VTRQVALIDVHRVTITGIGRRFADDLVTR
jgi:hypothetical protein